MRARAPLQYFGVCNLLSYVSLFCGFAAVTAARSWHSWEGSGLLIAISALADTFDGKFARCFSRDESEVEFGGELDSLVDAVSFGVVPMICLDSLLPSGATLLQLAASFVYVVCAVTRLGYFNVHQNESSGFVGLPTTLAALIWSTVFLLHPSPWFATLMMVVIGCAMVLPLRISRPRGVTMWLFMTWFLTVFGFYGLRIWEGNH